MTKHGKNKSPMEMVAERVRAGDRRALARAITLAESQRSDHRADAERLLLALLPPEKPAFRLGISGTPGVGKSTFIEAFGNFLIENGQAVAVLAVDPTSKRSGGSILGDKTRMESLAKNPRAFVRPSPAGSTLGGVARRTREVTALVEAAGYDIVIIETVGVGQSETTVTEMVDMFVLLLAPGGGDELQGIKRGITELADLVIINKADGNLLKPAQQAAADYHAALGLMRPKSPRWSVPVKMASSIRGTGLEEIWAEIGRFREVMETDGTLDRQRAAQNERWMWQEVQERLIVALQADRRHEQLLHRLQADMAARQLTPETAAARIVEVLLGRGKTDRQ